MDNTLVFSLYVTQFPASSRGVLLLQSSWSNLYTEPEQNMGDPVWLTFCVWCNLGKDRLNSPSFASLGITCPITILKTSSVITGSILNSQTTLYAVDSMRTLRYLNVSLKLDLPNQLLSCMQEWSFLKGTWYLYRSYLLVVVGVYPCMFPYCMRVNSHVTSYTRLFKQFCLSICTYTFYYVYNNYVQCVRWLCIACSILWCC